MGYDFETDKTYNFEKDVSMTIETEKTCYFPGEFVNGKIILKPKEGISNTLLSYPNATFYLMETFHYTYTENEYVARKGRKEFVTKTAEENMTLLTLPMNFMNFQNANIMNTVIIPFQIQLPMIIYPSLIFSSSEYVKHYLSIDFPSIFAKKTVILIIKNNQYYTTMNQLLKTPAVCFKETTKHKLFVSQGSFTCTLKLPKNAFAYDEMIPFEVDIDCSKLSINVKGIKLTINRNNKKNHKHNHSEPRSESKSEVVTKKIPLNKDQKKYHIEDCIQLNSEYNPKNIYAKLDSDKRKYSEKYNGVYLYPSCFGGLLSCEYYIKMVLEMDSMLSTNEDMRIPIDLYATAQPGYQTQPSYPPQQPYPQQPYPQQPYPQQPYPQQPYPQQPYPQQPYPQQPYPQQPYPQQQIPPQQPQQYPNQSPSQYPPQQYPNQPPSQYPNQPPSQYPNQPPSQYPNQPPSQIPPQQYPNQPPSQYPNQPPSQYPPNLPPAQIPASVPGSGPDLPSEGEVTGNYPKF